MFLFSILTVDISISGINPTLLLFFTLMAVCSCITFSYLKVPSSSLQLAFAFETRFSSTLFLLARPCEASLPLPQARSGTTTEHHSPLCFNITHTMSEVLVMSYLLHQTSCSLMARPEAEPL